MSTRAHEARGQVRYDAMVESRRIVARTKREGVVALLDGLAISHKPFTTAWLAREAEVSPSYLYRTPALKSAIDDVRRHPPGTPTISDDRLDAVCRAEVALRKENGGLRRKIAELEKQVAKIPALKTQLDEARKQLNSRYVRAFEASEYPRVSRHRS